MEALIREGEHRGGSASLRLSLIWLPVIVGHTDSLPLFMRGVHVPRAMFPAFEAGDTGASRWPSPCILSFLVVSVTFKAECDNFSSCCSDSFPVRLFLLLSRLRDVAVGLRAW